MKVLDLRTSRYLEIWRHQVRDCWPALPVEPIFASVECFSFKTLLIRRVCDGIIVSSSSICPLVNNLRSSSFELQRVSIRGCAISEEGLVWLPMSWMTMAVWIFGHITKPVMKQLSKYLATIATLRKLKLEHRNFFGSLSRKWNAYGICTTWMASYPLQETGDTIGFITFGND